MQVVVRNHDECSCLQVALGAPACRVTCESEATGGPSETTKPWNICLRRPERVQTSRRHSRCYRVAHTVHAEHTGHDGATTMRHSNEGIVGDGAPCAARIDVGTGDEAQIWETILMGVALSDIPMEKTDVFLVATARSGAETVDVHSYVKTRVVMGGICDGHQGMHAWVGCVLMRCALEWGFRVGVQGHGVQEVEARDWKSRDTVDGTETTGKTNHEAIAVAGDQEDDCRELRNHETSSSAQLADHRVRTLSARVVRRVNVVVLAPTNQDSDFR